MTGKDLESIKLELKTAPDGLWPAETVRELIRCIEELQATIYSLQERLVRMGERLQNEKG